MRRTLAIPPAVLLALLLPAAALGATDTPGDGGPLVLPEQQFYAFLIGAAVPLIGYVINRHLPTVSQPVKLAVQTALAAIAGVVYQLADSGDLGFNTVTLQIVVTTVIGALLAHRAAYRPANINTRLGGYAQGEPADSLTVTEPRTVR
jgi:hypothetical protein